MNFYIQHISSIIKLCLVADESNQQIAFGPEKVNSSFFIIDYG